MSPARKLVAAGVIRAGHRHDALPAAEARRPIEGVNLLDTPLGAGAHRAPRVPLSNSTEPDLSGRYTVPTAPAVTVDQARLGLNLARAIEDLELDRFAHRLLVWADSWSQENLAGLVSLIEAARAAGGGPW